MEKLALGIDIGSTGCKAVVMDRDRRVRYESARRYDNTIVCKGLGIYDQEPEILREAAFACIRELASGLGSDEEIGCIGLTGQMHGLVALDKNKKPLRPIMSCVDFRNEKQTKQLYEKVGGEAGLLPYTNNKLVASCTAGKILWMMENEPELFKETACVINPKDYVRLELTGICATDRSDASGFGVYDVERAGWNRELLKIAGIPENILPEVFSGAEIVGKILPEAAKETGVSPEAVVIAGGGDAIMQTLGTGGNIEGVYSVILGSGGLISASLKTCAYNEGAKLQIYCSGVKDEWVAYTGLMCVGTATDWFKNRYYGAEATSLGDRVFALMEQEAEKIPAGCQGLLFFPSLMGQRNPVDDPFAKGVVAGLAPVHTRAHAYRALLEGLSMGMMQVFEQLESVGGPLRELYVSGGGAACRLWCQILADVFGVRVRRVKNFASCGAASCAMMGLKALGYYEDEQEVYKDIPVGATFQPNTENRALYDALYEIYKKIYPAMAGIFEDIRKFEECNME